MVQSSSWFPLARQSVREARWWVVEQLERAGHQQWVDDAALCISELAANAVMHARTSFVVDVDDERGSIHLSVTDACDDMIDDPTVDAHVDHNQITGRGLHIVAAVAARWGMIARDDGGKTVWCDLA